MSSQPTASQGLGKNSCEARYKAYDASAQIEEWRRVAALIRPRPGAGQTKQSRKLEVGCAPVFVKTNEQTKNRAFQAAVAVFDLVSDLPLAVFASAASSPSPSSSATAPRSHLPKES